MSIEAIKIEIIEAVLQMQSEETLASLMNSIHLSNTKEKSTTSSILSAVGSLSDEEAEEIKQIIEEHFEKIDPNDWK